MLGNGGIFEQQRAQSELGAEVSHFIPEDAEAILVKVSATWSTSMEKCYIVRTGGGLESFSMGRGFDDEKIYQLREAMYQDGLGTWFSAEFKVDRSGAVDAEFNYDDEPEWDAPVDPIAYVTDQEKYPRDVENQPDWLKAKLAEGLARREQREK